MLNEFISKGISSRVIVMDNNSSERKGYEANLANNNEENNLHHAIESAGLNKLGNFSSSIYRNINEFKQNVYLKLISAIHNLYKDNSVDDHNNETRLVIRFNFHNNGKYLND